MAADNKLKELIMARGLALGETESGRQWCVKALHPAEPLVTLAGIPDEDSYPVVFQNYAQSVTLLNPLPGNEGNWDADVFFFPHPYIIGAVRTTSATGVVTWSTLLNEQIAGATFVVKKQTFLGLVQRYRIAYMGITGYHDASAVSNNGLIAAAQYMDTSKMFNVTGYATSSWFRPCEGWPDPPRTFTQLQSMPNAYYGAAREGVYVPYRLSQTHQDWQNASDTVVHANNPWCLDADGYAGSIIPTTAPQPGYPYGLAIGPYSTVTNAADWLLHRRSDCGVVQISIKQIAQDASFSFYYRSGWEYQVLPGSTLSCFARSSPEYDPQAISAYFKISRELKDAYPANFNDLGKILGVIANVAKEVVSTAFPIARPILGIAQAFLGHKAESSPLGSTQPVPDLVSAAKKEKQQAQIASAPPAKEQPVQSKSVQRAKKKIAASARRK